jgi:plastocyanin
MVTPPPSIWGGGVVMFEAHVSHHPGRSLTKTSLVALEHLQVTHHNFREQLKTCTYSARVKQCAALSQYSADDTVSVARNQELTSGQEQGTVTLVFRNLCLRFARGVVVMRALMFVLPVVLLMAALAACSVSSEDADDSVAADATETPVMDTQQNDDADDSAVDDATVDDADDSATDDAADDATDDTVDDAADDAVADDDEDPEPTEHIIELVDGNEFSPSEITIRPGDTVTWVNNTDMVHTSSADPDIASSPDYVQLPDGAEPWHSGNIEPGAEYSVTLDVPGEYIYFCYPHQEAGMIGTIIVEDPDPEVDEADDAEPTDDDDDTDDVDDDDDTDDYDAPVTTERTYNGKDASN